jgi:hypothetical protein
MSDHDHLPTLLDILNDIALNEETAGLDRSIYSFFFNNHNDVGKFEVAQTKAGDFVLSPISSLWNTYYRGENSVHEPCKASIYRGYVSDVQRFTERIKTSELGFLIDEYPLTHIFREGINIPLVNNECQICNLAVDYFAIAQHYGIKTDLLDFTSDKWVAAFFASTEYRNDRYYPIEDDSREGMFYIYSPMPDLPGIDAPNKFRPVGLQPFSRPGEQKGFVLQLNEQDDLNKMNIRKIRFRHDKNVSHLIYNYSNRSNKLFPEDILATKTNLINESETFSLNALEITKQIFYPDVSEKVWDSLVVASGLSFQNDHIVSFTLKEMDDFQEQWTKNNMDEFFKHVLYRKVYT